MESHIGKSFKSIKSMIYKQCKNGFYVRAKPNKCNPNIAIKYIGRYLGRPVISTNRIDNHDGENVTFHYNRHEDEKLVVETIPAVEFMKLLIQHIPNKNFKIIRYYGIYARQRDQGKKLRRAISKENQRFFTSFTRWRDFLHVTLIVLQLAIIVR